MNNRMEQREIKFNRSKHNQKKNAIEEINRHTIKLNRTNRMIQQKLDAIESTERLIQFDFISDF